MYKRQVLLLARCLPRARAEQLLIRKPIHENVYVSELNSEGKVVRAGVATKIRQEQFDIYLSSPHESTPTKQTMPHDTLDLARMHPLNYLPINRFQELSKQLELSLQPAKPTENDKIANDDVRKFNTATNAENEENTAKKVAAI